MAAEIPATDIRNDRSRVTIGGRPVHVMLVSFPIACFVGALVTDIAYWRSMSFMWETFSVWLITAGLVMAAFAVIAGLIDFIANHRFYERRSGWIYTLGSTIVIVLSLFNVFVHSRDGYTAVVPTGIILSALVVLVMIITGWMAEEMVYRQRVGVSN